METLNPAAVKQHPFLARLKIETRAAHEQIETAPLLARLFADDLKLSDYRELIVRMLGFVQPLEVLLKRYAASIPQHTARLKTPLLIKDCDALGVAPPPPSDLLVLPPVTSVSAALGVTYVLEGSTMGGRVLCKQLRRRFGDEFQALSYYEGYGANTHTFWSLFRDDLVTRYERGEIDGDDSVDAATATFERLYRWLSLPQNELVIHEC